MQEGVSTLRQQAQLFGYQLGARHRPARSSLRLADCSTLPDNSQADQAYTAIGQEFVKDTALQNAMVAAGIANGGVVMTPHLMSSIHDSQGTPVQSYTPKPMSAGRVGRGGASR